MSYYRIYVLSANLILSILYYYYYLWYLGLGLGHVIVRARV